VKEGAFTPPGHEGKDVARGEAMVYFGDSLSIKKRHRPW